MSTQALATLEANLKEQEQVGRLSKKQAIVASTLLTLLYQVAAVVDATTREKKVTEKYAEYDLPHLNMKFYHGSEAAARMDQRYAHLTDRSEIAKGLYHVWKLYEDQEIYGQQHEMLVRALSVSKKYLLWLFPQSVTYSMYSLSCGLMIQATPECGRQFCVELSYW